MPNETNLILAALERLEAGQAKLESGQARLEADLLKMRVDIMARMDEHANQLTLIRDDITVAMGQAASVRRANETIRGDVQFLIDQSVVMERQIRRLQDDVRDLKGPL